MPQRPTVFRKSKLRLCACFFLLISFYVHLLGDSSPKMLSKAPKDAVRKLKPNEKVVGPNRSFREIRLEDRRSQRSREGFESYRIDFVKHMVPHNRIFPNVAQYHLKKSPTMVKYLRVNFVADLDYLRWNLHHYLAQRIMDRYPGYGLEMVLNQDLRKQRAMVWKLCSSMSRDLQMKLEVQRDRRWDFVDVWSNTSRHNQNSFSPMYGTVIRLHGTPKRSKQVPKKVDIDPRLQGTERTLEEILRARGHRNKSHTLSHVDTKVLNSLHRLRVLLQGLEDHRMMRNTRKKTMLKRRRRL
mmetsp:Transcript_29953/g.55982  ORF Transcript_29953/g.55982 Transcript_29953/m.55982 type:complete len:298 (-) Transcript_29953:192-1085(-)